MIAARCSVCSDCRCRGIGFIAAQLSALFAMMTAAFAKWWSIRVKWVAVDGGETAIIGVWPERWGAGPAEIYWLSLGIAARRCGARIIVFSRGIRAAGNARIRCAQAGDRHRPAKRIQWTEFVIAGTADGIAARCSRISSSCFPTVWSSPSR